jgi:hypothetical protein
LLVQKLEAQVISTRDQQIVLERDRGDTVGEVGSRHGISHQRVSAVMANATEIVNAVDLQLMIAKKTGEVVGYIVPFSEHYTLALDFSSWLAKRLRDRGMQVDINTRRTTNGLVLFLADATPRRAR